MSAFSLIHGFHHLIDTIKWTSPTVPKSNHTVKEIVLFFLQHCSGLSLHSFQTFPKPHWITSAVEHSSSSLPQMDFYLY